MFQRSQSITGRFLRERQTPLQQICALNVDSTTLPYRMTNIVCTVGPACDSIEMLEKLIISGMNICRFSMSHRDHKYHQRTLNNLREASRKLNRQVATALDIQGPATRIGRFKPELEMPLKMKTGQTMELSCDEALKEACDVEHVYITKDFIELAEVGNEVYIEDGPLSFVVEGKTETTLQLRVKNNGELKDCNPCHIPMVLPSATATLSQRDIEDIKFAVENNMDMVFVSYTWCPEIIEEVRQQLGEASSWFKVVAKIENYQGVKRFNEILEVSDGVMVARGHLGVDIPPEKVFLAQKMMIGRANLAGKPIICAAQMLDSMIVNARATRAESTDIANAILDGADCVMLSKETALGMHPVQSVKTISTVCQEAENAIYYAMTFNDLVAGTKRPTDITHSTAIAAVEAAVRSHAAAIIVLTSSGRSAALIARYRPPCVIIASTRSEHTARALNLHRGCFPVLHTDEEQDEWYADVDFRIHKALIQAKQRNYVKPEDVAILVTGYKHKPGLTNTVRSIVVPDNQEHPTFMGMPHLSSSEN